MALFFEDINSQDYAMQWLDLHYSMCYTMVELVTVTEFTHLGKL